MKSKMGCEYYGWLGDEIRKKDVVDALLPVVSFNSSLHNYEDSVHLSFSNFN